LANAARNGSKEDPQLVRRAAIRLARDPSLREAIRKELGEENFAKLQRFLSRDIEVRFESLEDSMDKHVNGSDPVIALRSPELAAYRKHPRYLRLLRKAGFDDAGTIQ